MKWMKQETNNKQLSEFGKHGGLIIDEMSIQDDLVIQKTAGVWLVWSTLYAMGRRKFSWQRMHCNMCSMDSQDLDGLLPTLVQALPLHINYTHTLLIGSLLMFLMNMGLQLIT